MLDFALFKTIVNYAPLISIDLIVYNSKSEVLLGKRINPPAKNYYFVPGGRVYKNEKIADAFDRICQSELGCEIEFSSVIPCGVFEHFYSDAFVGEDISTHYIVLAYEIHMDAELQKLPPAQHAEYTYMSVERIRKNPNVHHYTQQYFS
ncbi:GDP-mannose mannosyl hydrolase [Citrobacter freundii]|uniref:GDP-mannose mannosyl hydrolase n=1 Tax=Citrobacter freundii TaxID=546 RepID=UPI0015C44A00|nr:GDP-mannose mannosyl hydrolase [Citrobacter freundii]ELN4557053.1 GDP-mannose mannosyl hydrolase [Citrobacter freundii]NWO34929.1 GDP-mannose mannosyl hydrolase [Citrobacter freundii]WOR61884.1 GDP-mannose mannosyl hydrolase [Citrobacter freundii]HBM8268810.1 GDP-mannose mannosyl hydrolase [Citrobacter freundii]HDG1657606.1 GDP-mannose mannosyl hydrolase [Citrobacter freundii]